MARKQVRGQGKLEPGLTTRAHGSRAPALTQGRDGVMGRGRQKAKDAKIARQLKYSNHGLDVRDLERELISGAASKAGEKSAVPDSDDLYDRWADDDN